MPQAVRSASSRSSAVLLGVYEWGMALSSMPRLEDAPRKFMESTLLFHRHPPQSANDNELLLSSMQSLESSFFLLATARYPHALTTCASAIESAIQAGGISAPTAQKLMRKARAKSQAIARFPEDRLDHFRITRNRITHRGFNPKDDSESTSLYLEIALPLLEASYRDFHSYELKGGLLHEYVELLDVAQEVHRRAKLKQVPDFTYCLNAFRHLIRWCFKRNFSADWEIDSLIHAEEIGVKFENTEREKREIERLYSAWWSFDCPICADFASVVCELDQTELKDGNVVPTRMACTACGFVVSESDPFLSEVLLQNQVAQARVQILKEYGIR